MTEGRDPDGFIVVHQPKDGSERYGIGPFPPAPGLEKELIDKAACDCDLTILWVAFPRGISMMAEGIDIEEIAEVVQAIIAAQGEPNDRLN